MNGYELVVSSPPPSYAFCISGGVSRSSACLSPSYFHRGDILLLARVGRSPIQHVSPPVVTSPDTCIICIWMYHTGENEKTSNIETRGPKSTPNRLLRIAKNIQYRQASNNRNPRISSHLLLLSIKIRSCATEGQPLTATSTASAWYCGSACPARCPGNTS